MDGAWFEGEAVEDVVVDEEVEFAEDGAGVALEIDGFHGLGEVFGGEGFGGLENPGDDFLAGSGDAVSLVAKGFGDVLVFHWGYFSMGYTCDMAEIVIEGRNTVHDALVSDVVVKEVMIGRESQKDVKMNEIRSLAGSRGVKVREVSPKELSRWAGSARPQNVVAVVEIEDVRLDEVLEKEEPVLLVFNRIDYERNLGAILRTAWAGGVDAVLVSDRGVHEITPVVSKVSMGGAVHVPVISGSLFPMLKALQDAGLPIVGVEAGDGEVYSKQNLRGGLALVFGGEDSGVSDSLRKYCDVLVHVPMASEVNSLNVSVATGVVLFEKLRQDSL